MTIERIELPDGVEYRTRTEPSKRVKADQKSGQLPLFDLGRADDVEGQTYLFDDETKTA